MAIYDINGNALNYTYDIAGNELNYAYDISGNIIYSKGTPEYPANLSLLYSTYPGINSPQGMATYGNYIFQFFSNVNKMNVYTKTDYSLINSMNCTVIGHGNNLQFGNEVQENGFPLLYCSDSNSADARYIYVLSIDTTQLSLVNTINLPSAVGNYPNAVIDFESSKIYTLGYTGSTVYDSSGRNVLCSLDLSNPSTVLKTWQYNYLGVMNGLVWNGEHVILNANTWDGTNVKFYFINPTTEVIDCTLTFEKEYDSEYQGFSYEGTYYLVSKWIYKNAPSTRTLYYEFYSLS